MDRPEDAEAAFRALNAIGYDDVEAIRQTVFDAGSLTRPYHSVNTDISKRIRYLQD